LAVKLRRLAHIGEPGNLVDLHEEAFDTGHDWYFGLKWRHTKSIWLKSSWIGIAGSDRPDWFRLRRCERAPQTYLTGTTVDPQIPDQRCCIREIEHLQ